MIQFLADLFGAAQFIPHGVCLLWRPDLLLMHGASDFLIAGAYLTIPVLIMRASRSRPDLVDIKVARLFALFILACALSHLAALMTLWVPIYGLQGVVKMMTAAVSVYTAYQLAKLLPTFLTLPSREDVAQKDAEISVKSQEAQEAQEARDKLTEFAYIASHDLKAPMRGLANHARFLMEDCGDLLDSSAQRRLRRMQDLCAQLEDMVATLLQYSRIGRSSAVEAVNTEETVNTLCSSLSEMLAEKNGTIEVETPLPSVQANPADVSTVFHNLVVNGLTYNDSEAPKVTVGFQSRVQIGHEIIRDAFYVRDNGIGIDEEFHKDVFLMFKRLNTPETYGTGAGAGLAFVDKVLESHGGVIRLDSALNAGSTFYFSFRQQAAVPEAQAPAEAPVRK